MHRGDVSCSSARPRPSHGDDDEIKDLIKRVVAVGGDTIETRRRQRLRQRRAHRRALPRAHGTPTDNLPRQEIPEGHVFVMGDNRTNSEDSRVFGPIDEDTIVGRAFVKVLPLSDIGWL